jgi:hypothetical protein
MNVCWLARSRVALVTSGATFERKFMKKTEIGKTKLEARALEQEKLLQSVIKIIAMDKAVATFGEKSVKWAINKYLTSVREKDRLVREKSAAEQRIAELNRKLGV